MRKDLYNFKDEEHQHVIKLLKELPKEKAPENFEYNLNIRIKNKNFDLHSKESIVRFHWKFLVPVAGIVTASFLVFITMFKDIDSIDNPFHIKPQLRTELSGNLLQKSNNFENFGDQRKVNQNDVILKEEESELVSNVPSRKQANQRERVSIQKKSKPNFPFDELTSTNLDKALEDQSSPSRISRRATLTGNSSSRSSFNGFYIREEVDKAYVEALKARNDSLKKALKGRRK